MDSLEDEIAAKILSAYAALPRKIKPQIRPTLREWVPLSGIALESHGELTCVALGTGMKCLPSAKVPLAAGMVLHDCHAEVIAIRGFNCFLIEECRKISTDASYVSAFIRRRTAQEISTASPQPFTISSHVRIHFYSTEAPCGDGSMELTISSQEDQSPWETPSATTAASTSPLRGRGYFSELGVVRTKPGRADSPPTLCKSCSDKLSLRQVLSALSSPTSLLVSPENAYISTFTLPPAALSETASARAFSPAGRMAQLSGRTWRGGYRFSPFTAKTTTTAAAEFEFSRRAPGCGGSGGRAAGAVGSNISAAWVVNRGFEALIGGVRQGRKQFCGMKGASMLCKMALWKAVREVAAMEGVVGAEVERYYMLKEGRQMEGRNAAKKEAREVLGPWPRNGGDNFGFVES